MAAKEQKCLNLQNVDFGFHFTKRYTVYASDFLKSRLGLVCTRVRNFVECTLSNYFNSFTWSALDTKSRGNGNAFSSIAAEILTLLASSSQGYQFLECSPEKITKYLNNEKTHAANKNKLLQKTDHKNFAIYEVERSSGCHQSIEKIVLLLMQLKISP